MKSLAIIGAGMSGMSLAQLAKNRYDVTLFESDSLPGGLIKCDRIDGHLYHMVGGHVFNAKRKDVAEFFWSFFNKDAEFIESRRNAVIQLDKIIEYPLENHIYKLDPDVVQRIVAELLASAKEPASYDDFGSFLENTFGRTLNEIYFEPYNRKIWKRDLHTVPLSWLEGKLPMPNITEIFVNNILRQQESRMVHSSFFYPHKDGSQFLASRLAEGLNIRYDSAVTSFVRSPKGWIINGDEFFDAVVYTGNIKMLPSVINGEIMWPFAEALEALDYHGTTSVLCEVDENPYSWVYLPDPAYSPHRIIMTGNFSPTNNAMNKLSATLEFTDEVSEQEIDDNIQKMPMRLKRIAHRYTKYTYPIQGRDTKELVGSVRACLREHEFYLLGRFAEWEYYNMDAAIGAAMDLNRTV